MMEMFGLSPDQYYFSINALGKDLAACEKRGSVPSDYDFGVQEVCICCRQSILPPKKPLRCSACKAVLYCSQQCSKRAWNIPDPPGHPTHKELCAANARHMLRLPDAQAVVKQFPWGRLEKDGTFNRDIARGRFGVYGNDVGFWSDKGGHAPHRRRGSRGPSSYVDSSLLTQIFGESDFLDGKDLLKTDHLNDEEGWKLPSDLIPYRNFANADKRPTLVTEFGEPVKDWNSWYRWRKLPKDSPAVLLMDYPLSVYQLVTECLKITHAKKGSPVKRVPLHIQMLGVEVELNYLPLFSELALLLPYHDIKLVMFGFSPHRIIAEARKHRKSVAAKCSPSIPIFSYKAPQECGSGTIDVYLHGDTPTWSPTEHSDASSPYGRPDALVACNAGLASYPEWGPVVAATHFFRIPFGVTEYAEQSAEHQRTHFIKMLMRTSSLAREEKDYPIEWNPFQKPGQRNLPVIRMPNMVNGFTMVVFKND
ncbi:hypothetical protein VKT23_000314 [Stygiomarasmius scandens]|uniref:MYND-type domain-containing protein n=1 Tax=Marasmiellus scandens TaxID=2682957 RepID=A0ABR1K4Y8_9AGAR